MLRMFISVTLILLPHTGPAYLIERFESFLRFVCTEIFFFSNEGCVERFFLTKGENTLLEKYLDICGQALGYTKTTG